MPKLLEVTNLNASYGATQALFGVSFALEQGKITTILGANGAGKTTTLRALCQTVKTSGSIKIDGTEVIGKATEAVVRMGVAHVPDGRGTFTGLTVEENLHLGGLWRPSAERKATSAEIYDMFPVLAERRRMRSDTLSGGERQQLAIGRALMCDPTCLLLDEPSLGLAPLIVTQILQLVNQLAREKNLAVLLVEQNAVTALRVATTGIIMNLGTVVRVGTAEEIAADDELRDAYLGS